MSDRDSEREDAIRPSEMSGLDDDAPELDDDADAGGAAAGDVAERNGATGGAE